MDLDHPEMELALHAPGPPTQTAPERARWASWGAALVLLQCWYGLAVYSVLLANNTYVLPCYRYVSLQPEVFLLVLPSVYCLACGWGLPQVRVPRRAQWALVLAAAALLLWPYVAIRALKSQNPDQDRCMRGCEFDDWACDRARIRFPHQPTVHPVNATLDFFTDVVFGRAPRLRVELVDPQSVMDSDGSAVYAIRIHLASTFLLDSRIFMTKGTDSGSNRALLLGGPIACPTWGLDGVLEDADVIVVPELDPPTAEGRGRMPLGPLRSSLFAQGVDPTAGMLSLTAEVTRAVLEALHESGVLSHRRLGVVVSVGGSVNGKQALLTALHSPHVTHVILDSPGAMGGVSDAVVGECAELTESVILPERYNAWARADLRRYPSAQWPFSMEDMWVALLQQRKRLLVHIKTGDLWSNPLGTVASVRSARRKVGPQVATRLSFMLTAGHWWDWDQHVSLLQPGRGQEACPYIGPFVRAQWGDEPRELGPVTDEPSAELVDEWIG